ncbi:MAG: hypothetical protein NVSMB70_16660 [Chamaesiphon sp.]
MIKIISPGLDLGSILMIKNEVSGTHVHDQKQEQTHTGIGVQAFSVNSGPTMAHERFW